MESKETTFNSVPQISVASEIDYKHIWAEQSHTAKKHELVHVISGHIQLIWDDDGISFSGGPGSTFITPNGTLHRDVFDFSEGLEIFLIHFSWDHFFQFFNVVDNTALNSISPETTYQSRRMFDDIRMDFGMEEVDRQLANARLMTVFMLFYRDALCQSKSKVIDDEIRLLTSHQRMVADAKKYLEKNYQNQIRLEDVADTLKVSPFYLSRVFSNVSEFSLFQYLTDVRINQAKKLLSQNRHIVSDVAQMVGIDNANYFSKVFKRFVGCSPTDFRNNKSCLNKKD
ncbi:MAG: helix-turn-helix transcriptional regulator [Lentisphaerae bacterium]|nr:helix-turn-helix transcriptional regulator [Lentisphaerota bacterium]MCP4102872.1 helix-turn-helix transcriptional regulator [Lentisphaerota bacterium]